MGGKRRGEDLGLKGVVGVESERFWNLTLML